MLRRLSPNQPASFEFTPANLEWAKVQMTKYPEGRQASAIIPVLWRAHEQEGWLTRPAIEYCADLVGLPNIRALEVATFYFMYQLQPVGSVAHIQICGTTTCMICGAEELFQVCRQKIAAEPNTLSVDGRFSWEEVECLGACANAPMAQIGKDFYEDLTAENLAGLIDAFANDEVPMPGSQTGRFASEPATGLTSLEERKGGSDHNASVAAALRLGDTIKRIDGTEVPILAKWQGSENSQTPPDENDPEAQAKAEAASERAGEKGADEAAKADKEKVPDQGYDNHRNEKVTAKHESPVDPQRETETGVRPQRLDDPRGQKPDDLKRISGIGKKLEDLLNSLGIWHFDQIASWSPDELRWVDSNLQGFQGRATRDEWVRQARSLNEGEKTEVSHRTEKTGRDD